MEQVNPATMKQRELQADVPGDNGDGDKPESELNDDRRKDRYGATRIGGKCGCLRQSERGGGKKGEREGEREGGSGEGTAGGRGKDRARGRKRGRRRKSWRQRRCAKRLKRCAHYI
eukprot:1684358-Pleurochrysis_carterae.AAC.3